MSDNRMDDRTTDLEEETGRASSFEPSTVRRRVRETLTPDRRLTPVTFGRNDPGVVSVFGHNSSPVQNFRFRNSTVEGYDSPEFNGFQMAMRIFGLSYT